MLKNIGYELAKIWYELVECEFTYFLLRQKCICQFSYKKSVLFADEAKPLFIRPQTILRSYIGITSSSASSSAASSAKSDGFRKITLVYVNRNQ